MRRLGVGRYLLREDALELPSGEGAVKVVVRRFIAVRASSRRGRWALLETNNLRGLPIVLLGAFRTLKEAKERVKT